MEINLIVKRYPSLSNAVRLPASLWAELHRHTPLFLTHTFRVSYRRMTHIQVDRFRVWRTLSEWMRDRAASLTHSNSQTHTSGLMCVWLCVMSWGCGLKYLFSLPPVLQQAGVCALRAPDDFSRLEMVQRLAKDGYRFLQNQNYRLPDRSAQVSQRSQC